MGRGENWKDGEGRESWKDGGWGIWKDGRGELEGSRRFLQKGPFLR